MRKTCRLLIIVITLSVINNELYSQDKRAIVSVIKEVSNSNIIYRYTIKNRSTTPIWMIDIGRKSNMDPILDIEPVQVKSPGSWEGFSSWLEDSSPQRYCVTWKQPKTISLAQELIQPGESKSGFIVIVKKESEMYINCIFTVYFSKKGGEYSDNICILTDKPKPDSQQ